MIGHWLIVMTRGVKGAVEIIFDISPPVHLYRSFYDKISASTLTYVIN